MAFRRRQDDWSEFVNHHANELLACGVAEEIFRDKRRFLHLLQEGWDEGGWYDGNTLFAGAEILRPDQAAQLATFVTTHFGEDFLQFVKSLRERAAKAAKHETG